MLEQDEREALKLYKKGVSISGISEKLGIPIGVLERWKDYTGWDTYKTKVGEPGHIVTVGSYVDTGVGLNNKNAVFHGLATKWMPEEMVEIMQDSEALTPTELLWGQILVQHAAIVRAQKIMYVKHELDHSTFTTMTGDSMTARQIQYSWEKYERYLTAQSKAMAALVVMIANYEKMARLDLIDEEQRLRIAKLKRELENERSTEDKLAEYFRKLAAEVSK